MLSTSSPRPPGYGWVAAIHDSEGGRQPLGTAVLVDEYRLITCAHVVEDRTAEAGLWVEFPMLPGAPRQPVARVRYSDPIYDVALLFLGAAAPAGAGPAPIRFAAPAELAGRRWWAFGFPSGNPHGEPAEGRIAAELAHGYLRLHSESGRLEFGFSGGGLWSPEADGVVAVVSTAAGDGDGQAVSLAQVRLCFPDEGLDELGRLPAAVISGWTLQGDSQRDEHWRPRARGTTVHYDHIDRFRGRRRALTEIIEWLDRDRTARDARVLVVTGSPGAGKSAVLSRIVTTADPAENTDLTADSVLATSGSVACAVHAKDKTAREVADEIAKAALVASPEQLYNLATAIREALIERKAPRFNIVIDGLDEAVRNEGGTRSEARKILQEVVLPLLQRCSSVGLQMVLGSRRQIEDASIFHLLEDAIEVIDLDDPRYFVPEDLEEYALATLQLEGEDPRPDPPYADERVARPVAARIAALAGHNFLIAGMMALNHGLYDRTPIDPARLGFRRDVRDVLHEYLDKVPGISGVSAAELFTVLAFAEAPGIPFTLWSTAVEALFDDHLTVRQLSSFVRQYAANFLVESRMQDDQRVFRLFHEALDEALTADRAQAIPMIDDQRELTRAFLAHGRRDGWDTAPEYLLRSLGHHAERAGMIDSLLDDHEFLLRAHLNRLTVQATRARTPSGRARAQLLEHTPYATAADAPVRSALFSVTEALERLGTTFGTGQAPYRALWATTSTYRERAAQQRHTGGVYAACDLVLDERLLLATAGADEMVRLWDPETATQVMVLQGHAGCVFGLAAFTGRDGPRLVSSGADALLRVWNPKTGEAERVLEGHSGPVYAVEPFTDEGGRRRLASCGADGTVRIWDPVTGQQTGFFTTAGAALRSICTCTAGGRLLVAASGQDGVRIWDAATGEVSVELEDAGETCWSIASFTGADGRPMLASSGQDVIRVWDLSTGRQEWRLEGHAGGVWSIAAFKTGDNDMLLASTADDEMLRVWDPATGKERNLFLGEVGGGYVVRPFVLNGRVLLVSGSMANLQIVDPVTNESLPTLPAGSGAAWSLGAFPGDDGRVMLASSGGSDGVVRIIDPRSGEQRQALTGHTGSVWSVCSFTGPDGGPRLASAGDDATLRVWDARTGRPLASFPSGERVLWATCALDAGGTTILATGSADGVVRLHDAVTGDVRHTMSAHTSTVWWLCAVSVGGKTLLASAGNDGGLILWNPVTGSRHRDLAGHPGGVWSMCELPQGAGRPSLLVSGGADALVRIWDPETGDELHSLEGHTSGVWSVCTLSRPGAPPLLVSSSDDATIRVWDPDTSECRQEISAHVPALVIQQVGDSLVAGLATGLLGLAITEP